MKTRLVAGVAIAGIAQSLSAAVLYTNTWVNADERAATCEKVKKERGFYLFMK